MCPLSTTWRVAASERTLVLESGLSRTPSAPRSGQTGPMEAIRAAQTYDGTAFLGPATVMVDGDTIVGVESGHPDLPDGVEVTTYDGTLLPGLIDCHVHLVADGTVGSLEL